MAAAEAGRRSQAAMAGESNQQDTGRPWQRAVPRGWLPCAGRGL